MSEKPKEDKTKDAKRKKRKERKEDPDKQAKVAAALEEESSEEEGPKVTRVGYVEMKIKSWKAMYCLLIGGSLYWFKSSTVRAFEWVPLSNCLPRHLCPFLVRSRRPTPHHIRMLKPKVSSR